MSDPDGRDEFCYLTTKGRVSGSPHRIEIWFSQEGETIYLLAGGGERADWVRNLIVTPAVEVEIGGQRYDGKARIVDEPAEDALARKRLLDKYQPGDGGDLSSWGASALPVAIDLS